MVEDIAIFDDLIELDRLHTLQKRLSPAERTVIGSRLAENLSDALKTLGVTPPEIRPDLGKKSSASLDLLSANGIAHLGQLLDSVQAQQLATYFDSKPCYDGHHIYRSNGIGSLRSEAEAEFTFGSYSLADILQAPYLLEIANSPEIVSVVAAYLGCMPTLFSLNVWWSFAKNSRHENVTQHLHRDTDDFKFCTLFIYLADVDETNGPHEYLRSTQSAETLATALDADMRPDETAKLNTLLHDFDRWANTYYVTDKPTEKNPYSEIINRLKVKIVGPAGTAFLIDNYGLHFGHPLRQGKRLVFWARYGLYKNATYKTQRTVPIKDSGAEQRIGHSFNQRYLNRLIIDYG